MNSQSNESFNMNMMGSSGDAGGGIVPQIAGEDGTSLAAQLAGGGAEFVMPSQRKAVSKSTVIFIAVAAVAACGLFWMKQRTGGPTPAEAKDPNVDAARASIQQFLAGGTGSVEEMKRMLSDSNEITDKFATYSENRQVPLESLKTNPFFLDSGEETPAPTPRVDGSRQQAEARRLEMERLASAASKLSIQTIFFGRNPTAMIDGKICQVGQQLGEFTITAIRADGVEVAAGGQRFDLMLKR